MLSIFFRSVLKFILMNNVKHVMKRWMFVFESEPNSFITPAAHTVDCVIHDCVTSVSPTLKWLIRVATISNKWTFCSFGFFFFLQDKMTYRVKLNAIFWVNYAFNCNEGERQTARVDYSVFLPRRDAGDQGVWNRCVSSSESITVMAFSVLAIKIITHYIRASSLLKISVTGH